MQIFQLVIALLLAGAILTTLAQRIGAPYPALLAMAGVALAFAPAAPMAALDPELALALFVAPVLLDAAYDASPRDLGANWLPVTSLVLVAVGLTVIAVAVVARLLVPGMPWPVALVLGAIVAPPDASAATAVLRQLSPPHRVLVILEGESLLNDASALLIYRVALAAVGGAAFSPWQAAGIFALSCFGGGLLGYVLARLFLVLAAPVSDIAVSVVTQFVATFAVWLIADRLGVSPVLTMVAYAVTLARQPSRRFGAEHRRASYAVWEVAVFVLNALAFILIGLQFKGILSRLDGNAARAGGFAAAVLATVIVVRFAWVMAYNSLVRFKYEHHPTHRGRQLERPTFRTGLVISWCGMRGIVTLAAALALPDGSGGQAFPYRDLVVAAALAVVVGTLVLQGFTLGPLLRWLRLDEDRTVDRETALARRAAIDAAQLLLQSEPGEAAAALRAELQDDAAPAPGGTRHALLLRVIAAQRRTLLDLRARRTIGDDAYHRIEEELDWAEGHALRQSRAAIPDQTG
jgi:CPA1 family monovalent cation:H+ antiporter